MTPTEQAARIQEIKNSTEIVNMGIVDDLGDETVAWAGRSDFGTMGWFVGVTPGIDVGHNGDDRNPRHRLRDMVRLLAGVAGQGPNV